MPKPTREQLVDRATRLVDRLRSMPQARLGRAGEGESSIADDAHALSQQLADLAADCEGRERRPVPRLPDLAAGDQVAVMLHDLVAVSEGMNEQSGSVALDAALTSIEVLWARI